MANNYKIVGNVKSKWIKDKNGVEFELLAMGINRGDGWQNFILSKNRKYNPRDPKSAVYYVMEKEEQAAPPPSRPSSNNDLDFEADVPY